MRHWKTVLSLTACAMLSAGSAAAQAEHEHHHHHDMAAAGAATAPAEVPPLEIQMPRDGDTVGQQVAVVLKTPADLGGMTMSAARIGVHLHIEIAGMALMPTRQQLIDLGSNNYLYLFDLPAKPGRNTIRLYWSDAQHRTLESTVRSITVTVKP